MAMPSSRRCGSPSITARSMNAPGSPSSALQIRYFWSAGCLRANLPLRAGREAAAAAAAQAAPLDDVADLGGRLLAQRLRAEPRSRRARCTRRCCAGSMRPQLASTQRVCGAKNGCSSRNGTSGPGLDVPVAAGTGRAARRATGAAAEDRVEQAVDLLRGDPREAQTRAGRAAARRPAAPRRRGRCSRPRRRRRRVRVAVEVARARRRSVFAGAGAEAAGAGADEDDRARRALRGEACARAARRRRGTAPLSWQRGRPRGTRPASGRGSTACASTPGSRARTSQADGSRSFGRRLPPERPRIFVARSEVAPAWNSPLTPSPARGRTRRGRRPLRG